MVARTGSGAGSEAGTRATVTRQRVLHAGIARADRSGLESLTMRKLGQDVGIEAMSLYNHVTNKDDLLDGMIDILFGQIELPEAGAEWMSAMRGRAISLREVLSRHPWSVALMESRMNPGPANLRHHNAVLGNLRTAGFSIEMAANAYSVIDSYVYGFAQTQMSLPFDATDVAEIGAAMLQQFPVSEYPYLAQMIEHAMTPGYQPGSEFEFGLELVLGGVERDCTFNGVTPIKEEHDEYAD